MALSGPDRGELFAQDALHGREDGEFVVDHDVVVGRKLALHVARFSGLAPLARPFASGIGAILMLHRVTAHPEKPNGVYRQESTDWIS